MNPYKHSLSLRIFGDFDPLEISKLLGSEHALLRAKGNKRGTVVASGAIVYEKESSYCKTFQRETVKDVVESIAEVCALLRSKGEAYLAVSKQNRVELFIGLFGGKNFGFVISPQMLRDVEQLGLALSFDVYPYDDDMAESGSSGGQ